MEITKLLKENSNWREIITAPPYCIQISENDDYILLKYNMLESDMYQQIVRECRGIIFDKKFNPVCIPFFKFGNYGEGYVPEIDWKSARVIEKVDGSIIKVWFHNEKWRISTNGSIDAFKSSFTYLSENKTIELNFGTLFMDAINNDYSFFDKLDKHNTYMFELVSPFNAIVVPYDELKIYHIGTRNNITEQEIEVDIGVTKPKVYSLSTVDDCLRATSLMSHTEEGFVVVDKYYNRVKIKSPAYVAVHHLRPNGSLGLKGLIRLIKDAKMDDILVYFPSVAVRYNEVMGVINAIMSEINNMERLVGSKTFSSQKEFALFLSDFEFKHYLFRKQVCPDITPSQWFWGLTTPSIIKIINNRGLYYDEPAETVDED